MSFKSLNLLLRSHVTAAVVARYWSGRISRAWRRAFPDASRDRRIAEARRAFEVQASGGAFSNMWFDGGIDLWERLLAPMKAQGRPLELLEVGSWEGRSALFLLGYLPDATLTAVDTWEGGDEHREDPELALLEQRFDHNLAAFQSRLTKLKGRSSSVLPALAAERKERFDFIYIDGSHFADEVMLDAVLAWQLLRVDGILVFDDYLWRHAPYGWKRNPAAAINLFLRLVGRDCRLLHVGHQLAVRKTESLMGYS